MPKKSDFDIRKFRTAVAKLKKQGLVSRSVDARSATPTRSLKSALSKFSDVLKGQATAIKASRIKLTEAELKARNYQYSKLKGDTPRVVIGHFKDEKIKIKPGGHIFRESPEGTRGFDRLELPKVRTDTVGHFFSDLKRNTVKLPDTSKGEYFAARFFNGRTQLFTSLRDLLNTLNTYDSVVTAHGRKNTAEIIRNIEIIRVPRSEKSEWFAAKKSARQKSTSRSRKRK